MPVAIAVWSIALVPGETTPIVPQADLRITNAALGAELEDAKARTSVKFTYEKPADSDSEDSDEDEEAEPSDEYMAKRIAATILCSLTPGAIEQTTLDLVLEQDGQYLVEVVGKNTIYLTGNYIDQAPMDQPPFGDDDDSDEDSDEDAFDLRDIMEEDGDESRFEELEDAAPSASVSGKKRSSDAMDVESASAVSAAPTKKSKKQKAEDGKAVPVSASAVSGTTEAPKEKTKKEKKKEKDAAATAAAPAKQIDSGSSKQLEGGVIARDTKIGSGPQAKRGNRVGMRYVGKLDSGKVFDKNVKGSPFSFHLGKGEVIKGWDVGIVGMQVGGERILTIPAAMAYGKKKMSDIPANSTLTFEVKLVEIK